MLRLQGRRFNVNVVKKRLAFFDYHLLKELSVEVNDEPIGLALEHAHGAKIPAFHVRSAFDFDAQPRTMSLVTKFDGYTVAEILNMRAGDCAAPVAEDCVFELSVSKVEVLNAYIFDVLSAKVFEKNKFTATHEQQNADTINFEWHGEFNTTDALPVAGAITSRSGSEVMHAYVTDLSKKDVLVDIQIKNGDQYEVRHPAIVKHGDVWADILPPLLPFPPSHDAALRLHEV